MSSNARPSAEQGSLGHPLPAQSTPTSITSGGWEREGDHSLRHSTGWTIARYKVDELRVYLLWSPVGSVTKYGPFDSAEAAKRRHAELMDANHGDGVVDATSLGGASHG